MALGSTTRPLDTALGREPIWPAAGAKVRVEGRTYDAAAGSVVVFVSKR